MLMTLPPKLYRQQFRNYKKLEVQTYAEFARENEELCNRWCHSKEIDELKKLRELILIEEFRQCVHSDIRSHLDDRKPETLVHAARLADEYAISHKINFKDSQNVSGQRYQSHKN